MEEATDSGIGSLFKEIRACSRSNKGTVGRTQIHEQLDHGLPLSYTSRIL